MSLKVGNSDETQVVTKEVIYLYHPNPPPPPPFFSLTFSLFFLNQYSLTHPLPSSHCQPPNPLTPTQSPLVTSTQSLTAAIDQLAAADVSLHPTLSPFFPSPFSSTTSPLASLCLPSLNSTL